MMRSGLSPGQRIERVRNRKADSWTARLRSWKRVTARDHCASMDAGALVLEPGAHVWRRAI
jgi:hypothetical protein